MIKESFSRLSGLENLPASLKRGVVAIGNFDGVHRGHQAVLNSALAQAHQLDAPALVLTFEPHPRSFFKPNEPVDRLTSASEKAEILKMMGFDGVIEEPFTAEFAAQSPANFVENIIVNNLAAQAVVTGYDFHFGFKRSGNPTFMQSEGARLGFKVTLVDAFKDEKGEVVSSSLIRNLLQKGEVEEAATLLGYRYTITAEIQHGAQLGRKLGFPTANMQLPAASSLAHGIYAVRLRRSNGALYDGVASFGRRPTIDNAGTPLLETFLMSFAGDLYGETAAVSFFKFLRQEQKFANLDALVEAMGRDEAEAKQALIAVKPISPLDCGLTFNR